MPHRSGLRSGWMKRHRKALLAGSLLGGAALAAVVLGGKVSLTQQSDPGGIIANSVSYYDSGTVVSTVNAPTNNDGYGFGGWVINGVRQTDAFGASLTQATFTISNNVTATALYYPQNQSTLGDGVPDWYKEFYFGNTNISATSDPDHTGQTVLQAYTSGNNPAIPLATDGGIVEGGVSGRRGPVMTLNLAGAAWVEFQQGSTPGGLIWQDGWFTNGSVVSTVNAATNNDGYSFGGWVINGVRQTDAFGASLTQATFTISNDTVATALYYPQNQSTLGDGVPDWYKEFYFGSTNVSSSSDPYHTGESVLQAYTSGNNPAIPLATDGGIVEGGVSGRRGPVMTLDLAGTAWVEFTQISTPGGLVWQDGWFTNGSVVSTVNAATNNDGYSFGGWVINGVRQTDAFGASLTQATFTISNNVTATALYYPQNQSSRGDGVPDWYKEFYFGDTNVSATNDPYHTGQTVLQAYSTGNNPAIPLAADGGIVEGGVSGRRGSMLTLNYLDVASNPPSLSLIGSNPMTAYLGIPFTDPGATVTDVNFGTWTVYSPNSVNTSQLGSTTLTYGVTNPLSYVATPITRVVTVVPPPPGILGPVGASFAGVGAIITGGSTNFLARITNGSVGPMVFSASGLTNISGTIGSTTLSGSGLTNISGLTFNGRSVGSNQMGLFTVSAPGSTPSSGTGTVTVNVYGHSAGSLATNLVTLFPVHAGGVAYGSVGVSNATGFLSPLLSYATNLPSGLSISGVSGVAPGTSSNAAISWSGLTGLGWYTNSAVLGFGDDSSLAGASTATGQGTLTVKGFVYSGQSTWTAVSGNWTNPANWSTAGGVPGIDGNLSKNDSATFGTQGGGTVTLSGNAALNALSFTASNAYAVAGGGTLSLVQGSNAPSIAVGAGSPSIGTTLNLATDTAFSLPAGSQLRLSGSVTGPGALSMTGAGTLMLTGTNSYTGTTTLSTGVLQVGNGGATGTPGTGAIVLNGNSSLILNLSSGITIPNLIAGSGSLQQWGSGTSVLTGGANTFSGGTLIQNGALQLGDGVMTGTIGSGTVTIAAGSYLIIDNPGNFTLTNTVTGAGSVIVEGQFWITNPPVPAPPPGGTNGGGSNPSTNVVPPSYPPTNTAPIYLGPPPGSQSNPGATPPTLHVNSDGTTILSGPISGTGNLIQQGSGTLILLGTNTYTGGTLVSSGTLQGNTFSLQGVITNNSSVIFSQNFTGTYAGVMSGTGSMTMTGGGTVTFSNTNTYTGQTVINQGTLMVTGALSPSGTVVVNSGGTLSGSGSVGGVTVNPGGTLTPGANNLPGTLSLQSALWAPGGNYNWVLSNASGAAGSGYSSLAISGALDLSRLSLSSPFDINLSALTNGTPANFNFSSNYSWQLASFGSISNFSPADFKINTAPTNGTAGWSGVTNGTFAITTNGNKLYLNYIPNTPSISSLLYVATNGSDVSGDGSYRNPYASISKALGVASNGAVIAVSDGTYNQNLTITNAVSIISFNGPDATFLVSPTSQSVVSITGAAASGSMIQGFSISGGAGYAGSFNQYGGGMNLSGCGTVTVQDCVIHDNNASGLTFGGGMHVTGGATAVVNHCLLYNNNAWASGGGMLLEGGNLSMIYSTVADNSCNNSGYWNWWPLICGVSAAGNCNALITNSILWANGSSQYGSFTSGPGGVGTFSFSNNDVQGGVSLQTYYGNTTTRSIDQGSNFSSDPGFVSPSSGNFSSLFDASHIGYYARAYAPAFNIGKAANVITFPAVTNAVVGGSTILGASASSGLPVSYSTTSTNVVVTGSGVKFLSAGNATIVASQSGNAQYQAATPVTNTFVIGKGTALVSFSLTNTIYNGMAKAVLVTTVPAGLPTVTVYSAGTNYPSSPLPPTNAGSYSVVATVNDPNYSGSGTATLSILRLPGGTITFPQPPTLTLSNGPSETLGASASNGLPILYSNSTPSILSLNGSNATALSAGVGIISAGQSGSANIQAAPSVTNKLLVDSAWQTTNAGYSVSTLADGIPGNAPSPHGVTMDERGNLFITPGNDVVGVNANGTLHPLAGGEGQGSADGSGTNALFNALRGIVADGSGGFYVADSGNSTIRRIDSDARVTTIAGGVAGFRDGNGTNASFDHPDGIALDGAGNLYVSDTRNNAIRKITTNGTVSTIAGRVAAGLADGAGTNALFNAPEGIVADATGNLFVCDSLNNAIRKITTNGTVSTIAGNGVAGFADGVGTHALFHLPTGVSLDGQGNVFVADCNNNAIRRIGTGNMVSTIAGGGPGNPGFQDGLGAHALLYDPVGIVSDTFGNLAVADGGNGAVRLLVPETNALVLTNVSGAVVGGVALPAAIGGRSLLGIGDFAMAGFTGLKNLVISNGVTTIGSGAFQGCAGLASVTLPDSVTAFGSNVFAGCSHLTNITASGGMLGYLASNATALGLALHPQKLQLPVLSIHTVGDAPVTLPGFSSGGIPVTYTLSQGNGVAAVEGNSLSFLNAGSTTLIATAPGTWYWQGTNAVQRVTVKKRTQTISFSLPSSVPFSSHGVIHLNGTSSSGLPLTYTTLNTNVLTIAGGNATLIGTGKAYIMASQAGDSNTTAAPNVTVPVTISQGH